MLAFTRNKESPTTTRRVEPVSRPHLEIVPLFNGHHQRDGAARPAASLPRSVVKANSTILAVSAARERRLRRTAWETPGQREPPRGRTMSCWPQIAHVKDVVPDLDCASSVTRPSPTRRPSWPGFFQAAFLHAIDACIQQQDESASTVLR